MEYTTTRLRTFPPHSSALLTFLKTLRQMNSSCWIFDLLKQILSNGEFYNQKIQHVYMKYLNITYKNERMSAMVLMSNKLTKIKFRRVESQTT